MDSPNKGPNYTEIIAMLWRHHECNEYSNTEYCRFYIYETVSLNILMNINSLVPGRFNSIFKYVTFKQFVVSDV